MLQIVYHCGGVDVCGRMDEDIADNGRLIAGCQSFRPSYTEELV